MLGLLVKALKYQPPWSALFFEKHLNGQYGHFFEGPPLFGFVPKVGGDSGGSGDFFRGCPYFPPVGVGQLGGGGRGGVQKGLEVPFKGTWRAPCFLARFGWVDLDLDLSPWLRG